jgi:hypothetical protein
MLTGRGQFEEVNSAFARAARLAPGDFQPFLDNWWVVGPYPYDPRAQAPPQTAPGPTLPVPATPRPGYLPWRPVRADPDGWVDLGEYFTPSERISAYALTYLWTLEERELILSVTADDLVRVWLNGKLVYEYLRPGLKGARVTLKLQPGRNLLLVKVINEKGFFGFGVMPVSSGQRADKTH